MIIGNITNQNKVYTPEEFKASEFHIGDTLEFIFDIPAKFQVMTQAEFDANIPELRKHQTMILRQVSDTSQFSYKGSTLDLDTRTLKIKVQIREGLERPQLDAIVVTTALVISGLAVLKILIIGVLVAYALRSVKQISAVVQKPLPFLFMMGIVGLGILYLLPKATKKKLL